MTDVLLRWLDAGSTPLLALVAWQIWQIRTNHLPHMQQGIYDVGQRISRLEGYYVRRAGKR